jgi:hypothetical protein
MDPRALGADTNTNAASSSPMAALPGRMGLGGQVAARRTELRLPARLPLAAWTRLGEQISLLTNSSAWWLGDWLVYGRENFPGRYKKATRQTGLDYQTLRNYAWVAGRFPVSRRRESLSFQHHATVAALADPDQELWLDRATYNHWSVTQLRTKLKEASRTSDRVPPSAAALQISLAGERHERWAAAASAQKVDLTDWIVTIIDEAAAQVLGTC